MALTLKEQQAKNLYLHTDQTQTEIAELLDIDRKTLHLWVKKGMWEQMKRSAEQTPSVILQNIHNHIYRINKKIADRDEDDQCPTMQEIEMLRKLVMMTKAFPQKHTGTYVEVFSEFMLYLVNQDNVLAKDINPYFNRYISGVLKDENRDISGYARRVKENLDSDPHFTERKPEPRKEEPKEQKQKINPVTAKQYTEATPHDQEKPDPNNTLRSTSRSFGVPIAIGKGEAACAEHEKTVATTEWVKNGEFQNTPENASQPAPTNTHEPNDNAKNSPLPPSENLSENGELPEKQVNKIEQNNEVSNISFGVPIAIGRGEVPPEDWGTLPQYVREASLKHRPYIYDHDGVLWITHADDLEKCNPKMGDSIRYFPDVDPVRLHQIKTWNETQMIKRKQEEETRLRDQPDPQADYLRAKYIEDFRREAGQGNNSNKITVWKVNRY